MRTPFGWAPPLQTSLQVLCTCCVLWGAPAAALANDSGSRTGGGGFDRRVLALIVLGCAVGVVAGWASQGPPETRFRLLNKPKKTSQPVLVPPGPTPRLIPRDSPNAVRARSRRPPIPRQTPDNTTRSGIVDYIAAFADSERNEGDRVDYLLVSGDSAEESLEPPEESDR